MNIDDLYDKASKATPGGWSIINCEPCRDRGTEDITIWDESGNLLIAQWMESIADNHFSNIDYIAAADPTTVMKLIDYARTLRLDVEKMERNEEKILQENLSLQRKLYLYQTAINVSNAEIKTTNFTAEEIADMEEK